MNYIVAILVCLLVIAAYIITPMHPEIGPRRRIALLPWLLAMVPLFNATSTSPPYWYSFIVGAVAVGFIVKGAIKLSGKQRGTSQRIPNVTRDLSYAPREWHGLGPARVEHLIDDR